MAATGGEGKVFQKQRSAKRQRICCQQSQVNKSECREATRPPTGCPEAVPDISSCTSTRADVHAACPWHGAGQRARQPNGSAALHTAARLAAEDRRAHKKTDDLSHLECRYRHVWRLCDRRPKSPDMGQKSKLARDSGSTRRAMRETGIWTLELMLEVQLRFLEAVEQIPQPPPATYTVPCQPTTC
jgi:hypothetical protein